VYNLKKEHRIVSRRITHFVTKAEVTSEDEILSRAKAFVRFTNEEIRNCKTDASNIFNSDQSGFSYELQPKRTLALKGGKHERANVSSKNKCSHSYTIMPLISMDGKLHSPLLICTQ